MPKWKNLVLSIFLTGGLFCTVSAQAQTEPATAQTSPQTANPQSLSATGTTVNQAIDRIIAREHDEVATIRRFNPIIETYMQDMKPDKDMGAVPVKDHYYLGLADLSKGTVYRSMLNKKKENLYSWNPLTHLSSYFTSEDVTEGFLQMIYIDTNGLDRRHYQIEYVGREFLGEVRCLVFDVTPLRKFGDGLFKGRIWAEDQNYAIVRFNGGYTPKGWLNGFEVHFDSWRLNVQPGMWLPALIFSQESDAKVFLGSRIRFKSQTRLWGYNLKGIGRQTEFSELTIEASSNIQDQAAAHQDLSSIEAEREWQHQAEVNVIDRLQRTGLLAPPGEVDKVLETVVNNLEVTNNLDIQPEVHCRVLTTSTLEMFSIGHSIVLSRGLLDVLPDEAGLATMLAQELADIIITKPSTDQWGFNDMTNVTTTQALSHFTFKDSPEQIQMAGEKAMELLKNSPYKDKLGNAGLFLRQLDAQAKNLAALINPSLGNQPYLETQLISSAPELEPDKLDQIAALPIGARIKLDPWDDRVELVKAKPILLYSAREKMPFEVTPFIPFLTYYRDQVPGSVVSTDQGEGLARRGQQSTEKPSPESSMPGVRPPSPPQ
jgi:hypothetical protein